MKTQKCRNIKSKAEIAGQICQNLNMGQVSPDDAKRVLKYVCSVLNKLGFPDSPFPESVRLYLLHSFNAYLKGEQNSLEKAFGLTLPPGRKIAKNVQKRDRLTAKKFLKQRISGASLKETVDAINEGQENPKDESDIRKIYKKHKTQVMADEITRLIKKRNKQEQKAALIDQKKRWAKWLNENSSNDETPKGGNSR